MTGLVKGPEKPEHNRSQSPGNSMIQMESMLLSSTMFCPQGQISFAPQWSSILLSIMNQDGGLSQKRTVQYIPLCKGARALQCLWMLLLWGSVGHQKPFRLATGSKKVKTNETADLVLSGCILEICPEILCIGLHYFHGLLTRKSVISWRKLFIFYQNVLSSVVNVVLDFQLSAVKPPVNIKMRWKFYIIL